MSKRTILVCATHGLIKPADRAAHAGCRVTERQRAKIAISLPRHAARSGLAEARSGSLHAVSRWLHKAHDDGYLLERDDEALARTQRTRAFDPCPDSGLIDELLHQPVNLIEL